MIAFPEWIDGLQSAGLISVSIDYDPETDSITLLENYQHIHRMSKVRLWELESMSE